uniref:Uncharacterized protein n=1 Tax=Poecilia latipinna TaxID=48699 RepID=A0A3B3UT26_9TELE
LLIFHQGMLDPTKDPSPAVCSPGCTAVAATSGPPEKQKPSTHLPQVARNTDISVDRELYELIISKLEIDNKTSQTEDTLNRLMSAAGSTSISARKPSAQEELSGEAGRMISELPDLSFMQAKVLMFPVFLAPEAHSSPKLL